MEDSGSGESPVGIGSGCSDQRRSERARDHEENSRRSPDHCHATVSSNGRLRGNHDVQHGSGPYSKPERRSNTLDPER
jgi:hypothetical protein